MRISDWSSDVCSSDLVYFASAAPPVRFPNVYGIDMPTQRELIATGRSDEEIARTIGDRKSVVYGKSVSVRVDLGGRRIIKKKPPQITYIRQHPKHNPMTRCINTEQVKKQTRNK